MPARSIRISGAISPASIACLALGAALVATGPSDTNVSQAGQRSQSPTFSTSVTAVPVDVRVIDRKTGKPVTDLTQEDFTVLEDGVRQDIRHFQLQVLTPDQVPATASLSPGAPEAGALPARLVIRDSPPSLTPQRHRIFLFVLGYGRLQGGPVKGLDAAISFVRTRLLPQDHVAVFAYNRATDFSLDHEKVAGVIERFRTENDAIDMEVRQAKSGLAALYGGKALPPEVQGRIDRVFSGAGTTPFRATESGENPRTAERMSEDQRKLTDAAISALVVGGRPVAVVEHAADAEPVDHGQRWRQFDSFVLDNAETLEDMGNLYAAVAYLQKLEGEKHVVFVTANGISLPRAEDYSDLAVVAANGRVAVDVVLTGESGDVTNNKLLRVLSEDSGGLASIAGSGESAFDRLDSATRAGYLLGYYPKNGNWNGAERAITVKVNRPGVDVYYRRRYLAERVVPDFDRQAFITRFRLAAAMRFGREVNDIHVRLSVSGARVGGDRGAAIDARIDPSRLHFVLRGGVRFGRCDIALVFMNEEDQVIGGTYKRQTAHLEYGPDEYAFVLKEGIPYQVQVRVPSGTRYVKVIVYDYAADLLGSAGAWLN